MKKSFRIQVSLFLALFLLGLAGTLITSASKTNIIISSGIRTYRAQSIVFRCLLYPGIGGLLFSAVQWAASIFKKRKAYKREERKLIENTSVKAVLSTESGRLNEEDLRNYLLSLFQGAEPWLIPILEEYQAQMDKMNAYQARLDRLLALNGALDLRRAEKLLDRLEQMLFGNLRKAFNWIAMRDPGDPGAEGLVKTLRQVETGNETILWKAKELCEVMTQYINNQGGKSNADVVLDQFISTLREQIEEETESEKVF